MTTHHYVVLALTAGLTLAAAAPAAEVRGVVSRVDMDKKELVLEGRGLGVRGAVLVFTLPDQTPVMFGDQARTLSDLEVGRRVRVQYDVDDGRQVVRAIHVLGGPSGGGAVAGHALPTTGDAAPTGVLRHVGYSDREVTVIGPAPRGRRRKRRWPARKSADREGRQGGDAGRPQGGRYGDGAGREEGRSTDGGVHPGGGGRAGRRRRRRSQGRT